MRVIKIRRCWQTNFGGGQVDGGGVERRGSGEGGLEAFGGLRGGGGDVEVGLEAEGIADGGEGFAEALLFEPASEGAGGGRILGRRAGGIISEGAKKKCLGRGFIFWI